MFAVNDDLSIYATRGDIVFFTVTAEDNGVLYKFQPGDIVRMAIYGKKDANTCYMQKDFPVTEVCESVYIYLEEKDTKIGDIISKPKDYWYEVVLNPDTAPQTIIGYDEEEGRKLFQLLPESAEIEDDYEPKEEDFPVVDAELDMTSHRPVENQAIARAVTTILDVCERTNAAVAEKYVTPQMFGAIGDGVADDTEAIQAAIDSQNNVYLGDKTYFVKALNEATNANGVKIRYALNIPSGCVIEGRNASIVSNACVAYAADADGVRISGVSFASSNETVCMPVIEFDRCENVAVTDCAFSGYIGDGIVCYASQDITIRDVRLHDFTGHGVSIGKKENLRCWNVTLSCLKISNQKAYTTSDSSNPIIFTGYKSTIENIICENCAWGVKVQQDSYGVFLDNIHFTCGKNSTTNTGIKVQGETNYRCKDITVRNAHFRNSTTDGYVLYITNADNISVYNAFVTECENGIRIINSSNVTFDNLKYENVNYGFYCGDQSAVMVKNVTWIHSTGDKYTIFSVSSDNVVIDNVKTEVSNHASGNKVLLSTSGTGFNSISNLFRSDVLDGRIDVSSDYTIVTNMVTKPYQTMIPFTIKAGTASTEVKTSVKLREVMGNGKNITAMPDVMLTSNATTEGISIRSVKVESDKITFYHDESGHDLSAFAVLNRFIVSA